jgi:hypothetical protein
MAVYWRLGEDVTVAVSAGRAVFLDVARDRYAMLPRAQNATFVDWLDEPHAPMPPECCSALEGRVDLGPGGRLALRRVSLAIPCEVPGTRLPEVRTGWRDAVAVARTVIRAKRLLGRQPLRSNLEHRGRALQYRRPCQPVFDREATLSRAAVYHAVRHLAPARRVCLLDSLALVDWLGDELEGVQLVFGVTAYPFGAHCWVQTRQELLGDEPDTIGRYAPILHFSG